MATRNTRLYPRLAAPRVARALRDTPVVLVNGPRQSGKTTLVRELLAGAREYVTLDDATALAAARADPAGFIGRFGRVTLDEVQRVPELLFAIKKSVDENRRPGRFLLTGSANLLALPRAAAPGRANTCDRSWSAMPAMPGISRSSISCRGCCARSRITPGSSPTSRSSAAGSAWTTKPRKNM